MIKKMSNRDRINTETLFFLGLDLGSHDVLFCDAESPRLLRCEHVFLCR